MYEIDLIVKLLITLVCGGIIGFEREKTYKPAGLRTHMLVSLGSTLFTMLSMNAFMGSDPSRIASSIIVGIGFIGAGTILKTKGRIMGLTTAASLWVTASIGMAIGAEFYLTAIAVTIIAYLILKLGKIEKEIAR